MKNKTIYVVISIIIVGIISFIIGMLLWNPVNDESKKEKDTDTEKIYMGSYDSENDVYYLHKSNLDLPEQSIYSIAQNEALQGIEAENFATEFRICSSKFRKITYGYSVIFKR